MNIVRKLTLITFFLLLIMGCNVSKQNTSSSEKEQSVPSLISFLVLNIHRDTIHSTNVVEFVSKKESTGEIKKQRNTTTENYLTIYAYSGKLMIDSLTLEHPLYKHFEYVDGNNKFAVKDTVLNSADFFVRLQGPFNEIKIFEILKTKIRKQLNTIKI